MSASLPSVAPSSGTHDDEARVWRQESLVRERREGLVFCGLLFILSPSWIIYDYFVQPVTVVPLPKFGGTDVFRSLMLLRIVMSTSAAVVALILKRATKVATARWATVSLFAIVCVVVGMMLPEKRVQFWPWLVGHSLVLFGCGSYLSWPMRTALPTYLVNPAAAMSIYAIFRPDFPASDVATTGVYLFSTTLICAVLTQTRYHRVKEVFSARYQLTRANEELSRTLKQLRETQGRLVASEKMSALGSLLAGLSHEINNPMNVIANNLAPMRDYLTRLEREIDATQVAGEPNAAEPAKTDDLDFVREDFHDALDCMDEATRRIQTIHKNLRVFIRGGSLEQNAGDLNKGLRATVAIVRRNVPEGVEIVEEYEELAPLVAQFDQLNQVHFNLIKNALDAVGESGTVWVRTRQLSDAIELSVTDTGSGVSEDARDHIFDPFFTTKAVGHGTGLGLSVCHRIVEHHGGRLSLDDAYTDGARFIMRLPCSEQQLQN